MYYCRSTSIQRAEKVSHKIDSQNMEDELQEEQLAAKKIDSDNENIEVSNMGNVVPDNAPEEVSIMDNQYDECLACQ